MTKLVYNYNPQGYYIGAKEAKKSPLENNVYLLPALATFEKPLEVQEGKNIKWDFENKKWIYEEISKEEKETKPTEEELLEEAKNQAIINRKSYLNLTDWYILREQDQAGTYPEEIKQKRILARTQINEIEQETDIDNITNEFD